VRFGSLFAGVGGFDLGLEAAGWECGFQVEWDAHCQQTLAHYWPNVPRWGDVSTVNGADLPPVDVITFGSPCQDLSVAGKRAGLEGSRSGLFFEATRIIREMQHATGGTFPRYAIWENVVGALNSRGGDDFEAVLKEMANLGACHLEWSVLDAQFFGVPQRRRRVFVVAVYDSSVLERGGGQIFAVGEGRRRDSAKGKPSRETAPGTVADGVGAGGGRTTRDVVGTLSPGAHPGGLNGQDAYTGQLVIEETVMFSHAQGLDAQPSSIASPTIRSNGNGMAVAVPYTSPNFAGYADGVGTLRANGGDPGGQRDVDSFIGGPITGTLATRDWKGVGNQYVMENKLVVAE